MKTTAWLCTLLTVSALVSACGMDMSAPSAPAVPQTASAAPQTTSGSRILIAYFSRLGNTNYPSSVDASTSASIFMQNGKPCGTTELLAREIQQQTGGDLFLIRSQSPYPVSFDDVVELNHQEIARQAFPPLASTVDFANYDVIFVGYPVWASTIPRPVATFLQQAQSAGKIVVPFCTHDGYSSGRSYRDIQALVPQAQVLSGLAVEAKDVPASGETVRTWLSGLPLPAANEEQTQCASVVISGQTLQGEWDDTPLAREIRSHLPVSVTMSGYGGREYYGPLPFRPANSGPVQRSFVNGDITYCPANNTIAIFYAQTDRPNLTMDVIKIGRITDDLTLFHQLGDTVSMTFQEG